MGNTVVEQGLLVVGVSTSSLIVGGVVAVVAIANPVGAVLTLCGGIAVAWSWTQKKAR